MQELVAPIVRGENSAAVGNLQDGLLLLLAAGRIEVPAVDRDRLTALLTGEQANQSYGDATIEVLAAFQRTHADLPLTTGEQVDEPTAAALNRELAAIDGPVGSSISGRVEFTDGVPAVGYQVVAFDRDLGGRRTQLGDPAVTGDGGVFPAIRYDPAVVAPGEGAVGPGADLVFEVGSPSAVPPGVELFEIEAVFRIVGRDREIAVPDLVLGFDANPVENVRIVLVLASTDVGEPEYDRLLSSLQPMLLDGATPASLDQVHFRDISFAARETGWDAALVETMRLAWTFARAIGQGPQTFAETCYGLLRSGPPTEVPTLPADLAELLDRDADWLRKLQDSVAHRIIGGDPRDHADRLRAVRSDAATQPAQGRIASIGDVLAAGGIEPGRHRQLVDAYAADTGPAEEFWTSVAPKLGWTGGQIDAAQDALRFADLLNYDAPLMDQARSRKITTARDLTTLTRADWTAMVTAVGAPPGAIGDTDDERIAATVAAVAGVVESTFPTAVIAHIARTADDPELAAARDLLERFFARETPQGFDVLASPVSEYLDTHADRIFDGMRPADRLLLTGQLQRLQRAFRLGVDRPQTESLLTLGLDSAFRVTKFSPEHFAAEFGDRLGGANAALKAYARAESIAGTVLYLYTDLWHGQLSPSPQLLMSTTAADGPPALTELPTYKTLFGGSTLCGCTKCQSFYSPAAYFVDLLHMLDRPGLGAGNPVEALFGRRPDLAYTQLTCENTNTLIPYVDLVTEILESFVANRKTLAFNEPPAPPHQALPTPSADELRVNPIYLTDASATFGDTAYAALQEAAFPLTLPLNLPLETTRAYLGELGTSRADLMPLLDRDQGLEALLAQTAEILELAPEEFELITGATFGGAGATRPGTTAEFFGLSLANTPTDNQRTLFNAGAPEFVRSAASPDPRRALISSLQNYIRVSVTGVFDIDTEAAVNAALVAGGLPPNGRTDDLFWGLLESRQAPSLSVLLCAVPMFLERGGLTYDELVGLVTSRFLNPTLLGNGDRDYLNGLDIPAADVRAWIAAGFPALPAAIQAKLTTAGEDPGAFTTWVQRRARAVVLNGAFDTPCDIDRTTLMHLDGTLLSPDELVALFRFIRLWKKLGWSLAEVDLVLDPGGLASGTVFNTVLLLANAKRLRARLGLAVDDLATFWQPIPTHGSAPLYDRLFRNRAAQFLDPVLALDADRTELAAVGNATPPTLSDHVIAVMAAFRLDIGQLAAVRDATGLADDPSAATQPGLTMAALSAIYRYVVLARALKWTVFEVIALVQLTGLDVFERPDRFPRGAALQFLDVVDKVRTAGVRPGELEYLCRGTAQPPTLPGTERAGWERTLSTLLDGLRGIATEEPLGEDPVGDQLTARLTSLFGVEDASAVVALIYGRDTYSAPLVGLPAPFAFPAAVQNRASYAAGRLRSRGALTAADQTALLAAGGVPIAVQPAWNAAVAALSAAPRVFVGRALAGLYTPAEAIAALVDVPSLDAAGAPLRAAIEAKTDNVMTRRRAVLSRALIKQTLATATDMAPDLIEAMLENSTVLHAAVGTGPAMPDYQSIAGTGLTASYFGNPTLAGAPTLQRTDPAVDFVWQGAAPVLGVPPTGFSVRWEGSLYLPAAGAVTFRARCTDGVRVRIDGNSVIDEWRDQPLTEFSASVRLDGGRFYPIAVEYYNQTGSAAVALAWRSPSIPAATIPTGCLYSQVRLAELLARVERIFKLGRLLAPFDLAATELVALAAHGDLTLDALPVGAPSPLPAAQAMLRQWLVLFDFRAVRDRYPATDGVSFLDVLTAAGATAALDRFAALTGAGAATLAAIVDGFTVDVFDPVTSTWRPDAPDLASIGWWRRIAETLSLVESTGAGPQQLLDWAVAREITQLPTGPATAWICWMALDSSGVDRGATNRQRAQAARDAVRARYDDRQWQTAATALNDGLRNRRKSALTGYILAMPEMIAAKVADTGRMFEFFLIDVEMQPCLETSRIKQGISSVQTYIQRVLLNLEAPLVPPSRIDRPRWEWTKSYRVWEANRKVFLHTAGYVTEAFRDNKTPLFTELESELLQDELTEPNTESAVRHYLEKLDDIAKLTVCGSCIDSDTATLHVFARTANQPFVFYHRSLDSSSGLGWPEGVWSPWQQLPVDVAAVGDGDDSGIDLMPIVWNRRLYLFWPVFEQKPNDLVNATLPEGFDRLESWHIRLAWSEHKDGRWSSKQLSAPFVNSDTVVDRAVMVEQTARRYGVNVVHHDQTTREEFRPPLGGWEPPPGHPNRAQWIKDNTVAVVVPAWDEVSPVEITDDPFLNGTKLEVAGEWALHENRQETTTIQSILPKPAAHYLDAEIAGPELKIRVLRRFCGFPTGQTRVVTDDRMAVKQGGRRTDRHEHERRDTRFSGVEQQLFHQLGLFRFPACRADIAATNSVLTYPYGSLARPQDTINTFMAFGPDWPRVGGLRLTAGADPILKFVPNQFDVIDVDNRSGFNLSGPFFYEDQRRCYLVTRNFYAFRSGRDLRAAVAAPEYYTVLPDHRVGPVYRAVSYAAVSDRHQSIAPDTSLRENPWSAAALTRWTAGPGVPSASRAGQPVPIERPMDGPAWPGEPLPTLSLPFSKASLTITDTIRGIWQLIQPRRADYTFTPLWHPYSCTFMAALASGGLPALYTLGQQTQSDEPQILLGGGVTKSNFDAVYKPDPAQVAQPHPLETVDFDRSGAYSIYNWETFLHIPMLVATELTKAGRYEDAMRWFHYVMDPMTGDIDASDRRAWRFMPFRTADVSRIEDSIGLLTYSGADPAKLRLRAQLKASIAEWIADPFRPDVIARRRPVVYMQHVFMKYLDNLIAWADELFQRDTLESINESIQLYILAADLLGPRFTAMPEPGPFKPETFASLRTRLDDLSNAQIDLETRLPFTELLAPPSGSIGGLTDLPKALYFCLPPDDLMQAYWNTVADRLFKIRHCMSIDGTVRDLPLFEPPIDPMLLVEAVAKGLDIGSVLNDLYAPLPRYRFARMLAQAQSLCDEVRTLGSTLLSIVEKRDNEKLASLRAQYETRLLDQIKQNKKSQIDEAEQTREGLEVAAQLASAKFSHFDNLLAQGLISEETDQLQNLDTSDQRQDTASWIEATAQLLNLIPNVSYGGTWSVSFGGSNLGAATSAVAHSYSYLASSYAYKANRSSITGSQTRRAEDWRFQRDSAKLEQDQTERQIAAARIRADIARAELANHETQIDNARSIEELLRTKFTNEALYGTLESTLRALYFQSYRAAYEVAKRAQRCWQYEFGLDTTFVTYGAWDSSVRGLLAGETLQQQLKQMERAGLEQQVREFEITKHVSVVQLDPLALITLKETGSCEIEVPEWLFDLDYPGHYFRRLKTVSLTVPAVAGPYTSMNATLTLLSSKVRESARLVGAYSDAANYRADQLPVEAIAVSSGQNDSGRFELNLRDERYLPFEGAGAVSRWRIELPAEFRAFDYDTISDVILHLRYTSRRDEALADTALTALRTDAKSDPDAPLLRLFSLRHEFPTEWARLVAPTTRAAGFALTKDRFPFLVQGAAVASVEVHAALILKQSRPKVGLTATLTPAAAAAVNLSWPASPRRYRSTAQTVSVPIVPGQVDSNWVLRLADAIPFADLANIKDLLLVVRYTAAL